MEITGFEIKYLEAHIDPSGVSYIYIYIYIKLQIVIIIRADIAR